MIHILLTEEHGRVRSLVISKKTVKIFTTISCITLIILLFMSISSIYLYNKKLNLRFQLGNLEKDLSETKTKNSTLKTAIIQTEKEKKLLLQNAIRELEKKSSVIESILDTIGIETQVEDKKQYSGGPFISSTSEVHENIVFKADYYLEKIQPLPLGFPVQGKITSKFGRRIDPFNKKPAFHAGIDIKNRPGTEIKSPADGMVFQCRYNSSYGRYIILDHENGFKTVLGHLKKILVKRRQRVKRGETIGLLGNTGRSTGPHLHYEIRYKGKPIDPAKFVHIAKYISGERSS